MACAACRRPKPVFVRPSSTGTGNGGVIAIKPNNTNTQPGSRDVGQRARVTGLKYVPR
jgi:hypothetical protein